jgi:hypothetical protein
MAEPESGLEQKAEPEPELELEPELTPELELEPEQEPKPELKTEPESPQETEPQPATATVPAEATAAETVAAETVAAEATTTEVAATKPPATDRRRRALFLGGWLASALAVGAGVGFGILAGTGKSKPVDADQALRRAVPSASPDTSDTSDATPPRVTAGVRADGTHYGSMLAFLLPVPDGYKPGPDEGELGNDSAVRPDQADPTLTLLFGALPASDLSGAQGAVAAGHMSGGAVRTYANEAGTLDIALTVLQLDPALSAKSTSDFIRIVKQSKAYRTGPTVPGHPDAVCVLPTTHVGDPLDSMTCLDTIGDTFAVVRAEGAVPLDSSAVTEMFGRQLDVLKDGLKA